MKKLRLCMLMLMPMLPMVATAQETRSALTIPFTLKEAGYVTLVIEDQSGKRVRNLMAETYFEAGQHKAAWDGLDDLGRDINASHQGIYKIPGRQIEPGTYTVKGLVHRGIKTSYEFSVYTSGNPPWSTDDHKGGWLANHTPPQAAVFVPAAQSPTKAPVVFLGNYVTEGPDGIAWVDLEGRKMGGKKWIGGAWTAAPFMARDAGKAAAPGVSVYVASVWETAKQSGQTELRISSLPARADKPIFVYPLGPLVSGVNKMDMMAGLAVNDGVGVVSIKTKNQLLFIDVKAGKLLGTATVKDPEGIAFDDKGALFVLSGKKLLKYKSAQHPDQLSAPVEVISSGLSDPTGITMDGKGQVYISDGGESNQVKVFSATGKLIRSIGKAGPSKAGLYDPQHMNNPAGLTVDSKNQLWVTEKDFLPKRVSVWSAEGKLIRAFYGPGKYGGGGTLDPQDKTKFYYAEEARGAMEFKLDWQTGESKVQSVFYRKSPQTLELAPKSSGPETPIYFKGKKYYTDCYSSMPTGGHNVAYIFAERNGIAQPVAAMGKADAWEVLKDMRGKNTFFIWTDLNSDGNVQANEVDFQPGVVGGITVMDDLSFCLSQLGGKAMQFSPSSFTAEGNPVYQFEKGKVVATGVLLPGSSGGNQMLTTPDGWTVVTQGLQPFERYSLSGARNGKPSWSYPNLWPGLHASHEAPVPDFPGELVGPTRLLGGFVRPKGPDAIPLWAINSNHGMVYVFTADGLLVSTLFEPMRAGKRWNMGTAQRGMDLKGVSLGEENFWPTITQTADGEVYMVDGGRSSLIKVEGLQDVERLPTTTVTVTAANLQQRAAIQASTEESRQEKSGPETLQIPLLSRPIMVDGKLEDWKDADWASIEKRGAKANGGAKSRAYTVTGSLAVSGTNLYLAYQTGDPGLLKNSGELPMAPFKTGGALDLMIGTDASAPATRKSAVAGDLRLLVTLINGKPEALLYTAVQAGARDSDKVPFSSPQRTVTFDRVQDISAQIQFAVGADGNYEVAVPLALLKLKPEAGVAVKGDIGILRGDGTQTLSRVYWHNKATGIVSDVPSEAELTPNLWGNFEFKKP